MNQGRSIPAVTIGDATAAEGDALTFTVTLSQDVSGGLTVTPSFTDGTATSGADYTPNTAALTFTGTAGETHTFSVATGEDAVVEADETFTVGLSVSGTTTTVKATDTGTGTITDGDGNAVVTIDDASANEGDTITFTVTLDKAVQGGLTVTPAFAGGSATSGTDYTENAAPLAFTGNASETQTLKVATTQDALAEPDETFTVSLSVSGTAALVTATDTGTGTITNDDAASSGITLSVDPDSVAEDAGATTVTVTATLNTAARTAPTPVMVTVGATDDAATEGTDYAPVADLAMSIAAGNTADTATFTLTPTDDDVVEGDETLSVAGTTTVTDLTVTDTTITITDDDGTSTRITLSVSPSRVAENDTATTVTVTATLNAAARTAATPVTVAVGASGDAAAEGTDYATVSDFTMTIAAGSRADTATFTLTPIDDDLEEGSETLSVSATTTVTDLAVTGTSVTITDDDYRTPIVTVADASAAEGDSITFTVTLDREVAGGFTVTPSFTDSTATGGGTDYTENTAALTFVGREGEARVFTVATTEDVLAEGDETFAVGLAVSDAIEKVVPVGTGTGTIIDDDTASTRITLSVDPSSVSEDGGPKTVSVTATLDAAAFTGPTEVTVSVGDTADTAAEGTDYAEVADVTLTIPAGETTGTATFTLSPTDDDLVEGAETLAVSGTATGLTVTAAEVTITDDDAASTEVTLSVHPSSVAEGAGATAVTVTAALDAAPLTGPTEVTVTVGDTADAAAEGTDYAAVADFTLTIPAGERTGTATFTLDADRRRHGRGRRDALGVGNCDRADGGRRGGDHRRRRHGLDGRHAFGVAVHGSGERGCDGGDGDGQAGRQRVRRADGSDGNGGRPDRRRDRGDGLRDGSGPHAHDPRRFDDRDGHVHAHPHRRRPGRGARDPLGVRLHRRLRRHGRALGYRHHADDRRRRPGLDWGDALREPLLGG